MKEEGIEFYCNVNAGQNKAVNDLLREYNAIVLAIGSTVPRDLPVAGRDADGIHYAMEFLKQQNKRNAGFDPLEMVEIESNVLTEHVTAENKNVIVIGGGDTGSDCVGTCNRQGAKSITQFELLPQPPLERNETMPWPSYPMLLKTTSSHEEGCEREWATATKEFIADNNGQLCALKLVNLEWKISSEGKLASFEEIAGSEKEIPCDLVLLAMGFVHPQHLGLIDQLDLEKDERGNIKASSKEYSTNMPKVFVAGDARRGQSLVVWAIREGRDCAEQVNQFLL